MGRVVTMSIEYGASLDSRDATICAMNVSRPAAPGLNAGTIVPLAPTSVVQFSSEASPQSFISVTPSVFRNTLWAPSASGCAGDEGQ